MLTTKKLKKFERSIEKLDEILSKLRSLPIRLDLDMTTETVKTDREDEENSRNYVNALGRGINKQKGVEEQ